MTSPLDEKALAEARKAVGTIPGAALWIEVEKAIRAYLSATALPDGMEVEKKLQAVIDDFDAEVSAALGREERPDLWDGGVDVHVSLIREAQSALAAMRVEVEHWRGEARRLLKSGQEALDAAETAEAEVQRLTEEKEALRAQRDAALSLMETALLSADPYRHIRAACQSLLGSKE